MVLEKRCINRISSSDAPASTKPEEGTARIKEGITRGNKKTSPNPVPPHTNGT
jgi:hypothetical protein